MMESQVDRELLEKIADLIGKPVGAFNIRKDTGCDGRQSTENIQITGKTDGKSGIDIRIKDGTKGEQCHIPVIITKPGIQELVYNDFYIGENCDVDIVAGCGIHNCGGEDSRHDGIHTFYVGKHSHVKYTEKHYGDGDGTGGRIMNPQTVVYLEEGATIQMETVQIRGIDSTKRETKIVCGKDAEAVVTERLMTHGDQVAESDMEISLDGDGARGRVISRSVAKGTSRQVFYPKMVGNAACFGHVQCDSIIMDDAHIESIPAIVANSTEAQLIHEAAIGKIAGDQLLKLETLGLSPEEAEECIAIFMVGFRYCFRGLRFRPRAVRGGLILLAIILFRYTQTDGALIGNSSDWYGRCSERPGGRWNTPESPPAPPPSSPERPPGSALLPAAAASARCTGGRCSQ